MKVDDIDTSEAVAQFRRQALCSLEACNVRPSLSEIARRVGEHPQHFHRAVTGQGRTTLDKLGAWVARWNAGGFPRLRLVVEDLVARVEGAA